MEAALRNLINKLMKGNEIRFPGENTYKGSGLAQLRDELWRSIVLECKVLDFSVCDNWESFQLWLKVTENTYGGCVIGRVHVAMECQIRKKQEPLGDVYKVLTGRF